MRIRHPDDWTEIRFVRWLLHDDIEYVQQADSGGRQSEAVTPVQESPGSRLSTITEEPSDLTEEALFKHDEPNWEQHDNLVSFACLQCAKDGQEQATSNVEDVCELAWLHVQDTPQYAVDILDEQSTVQCASNINLDEGPRIILHI